MRKIPTTIGLLCGAAVATLIALYGVEGAVKSDDKTPPGREPVYRGGAARGEGAGTDPERGDGVGSAARRPAMSNREG